MINKGYDKNQNYNILVTGGQTQVNIANDEATITANQNIGLDTDKLNKLIEAIKNTLTLMLV